MKTRRSVSREQSNRSASTTQNKPDFSEQFSKVASGIQSIAVVVSLLIGGWWALTTFVYQNPAFNEGGAEVAGFEPDFITTELQVKTLSTSRRAYEVTMTVTNLSSSLNQLLFPERMQVVFFQLNSPESSYATFESRSSTGTAIEVPTSESRDIHFLAEFPEDGIYVVEVNLCREFGSNCPVQRYVAVEASIE